MAPACLLPGCLTLANLCLVFLFGGRGRLSEGLEEMARENKAKGPAKSRADGRNATGEERGGHICVKHIIGTLATAG